MYSYSLAIVSSFIILATWVNPLMGQNPADMPMRQVMSGAQELSGQGD